MEYTDKMLIHLHGLLHEGYAKIIFSHIILFKLQFSLGYFTKTTQYNYKKLAIT